MRGAWDTGLRPFGIPLKADWTFLLWPVVLWPMGLSAGLQVLLILVLSILAHEYTHVMAAKAVGHETTDVTLYILGGAARIPDLLAMRPWHEALIAAAGPASSFVLAAIAFLPCAVLGDATPRLLSRTVLINLALGVFNALPLYPMDGGRILRAACSSRIGHGPGTKVAAWTTVALGTVLGVASAVLGFWNVALIMPFVVLDACLLLAGGVR